jgi:glycosyltransferase involved in cell wall biosynthesis
LEHFIEVAARIKLSNLKFLLAGFPIRGEEDYAQHLLKTAESRLGKRFVFVGHLTDMRPFCNALDLFINTSQEESFGISVLEALACGTPVVGYPSVAVQEVVLPGGGEIVEQDRIDKLTDALASWLNDPLRMSAARAKARRRAEDGFDIRKLSDQLWQEYETLLN